MGAGKLHFQAASFLAAVLFSGHTTQMIAKERTDRYGDPLPRGALTRLGTVRYRHGGGGLSFLPDGRTVVSVSQNNGIALWNARTGCLLRTIDIGNLSLGQASAFAPAAKRLAVSGALPHALKPGWRNVLRVFDMASGKEVRTFDRPLLDGAHALALTPDGKHLFSLGREGKLRIEEVATGVELLRQQFPADVGASLALSSDGSTVAVASGPNTRKLFVWQWQKAEKPRALKTPGYRGRSVTFSPDGQRLADCSDLEATLRVWDVQSGRLLHKLQSPDRDLYWYTSTAFTPDGKQLAAAGNSNRRGVVHLWDPATGKFLKRLAIGGGGLAFSPNGSLLAAGSRVWDFAVGKELSANDEAHRGAIECLVTGRGGVVVTASSDNTIRIWEAATGKQRRRFVHGGWIRDLALSPDGRRLVSSSLDDTVCLWDVTSGRKIYKLAGHGRFGGRRAVAFAPDGKSFLSWGDDMYLRRWDVRTGKAVLEYALRPGGFQISDTEDEIARSRRELLSLGAGRFSPDCKYLVLQMEDTCFVFDTTTGKELHKFSAAGGHASALALSPGGQLLASTWGQPLTWWNLATGQRSNQLRWPEKEAGPVAFAPNGRLFAVASSRRGAPIRLVEMASGREMYKIEGIRGVVRSLAFLPDGKRLVAGMQDSTALIWDVTH